MAFRLATLGRCNLEDEAGNVISVPTQSLFLCAYLYDIRRPVARRDAANLLWPGHGHAASTNLRSMLRRFSLATQSAPSPPITIDGNSLSINLQMLSCDLDFTQIATPVERLQAACSAIAMQFLPSLGDGKTALDTWVRDVRRRLLGTLRAQFLEIIGSETQSPDIKTELRRTAVLLLEADPDDHDIRRHLASGLTGGRSAILPATPIARILPAHIMSGEPVGETQTPQPRIALLPPSTSREANREGSILNALIEDLTIGLCSSRTVSVVAPYTSERIQASKDKAAALEKHNVVYALDSRRNDTHLFVQLIFTPTEEIIWADRFALSPVAIAAHRETMATAIQRELMSRIGSHQGAVSDFARRPEAYFLYLKGLQTLSSVSLPSIRRARKYFKEALEHGNDLPEALAAMSRTLTTEWILTARCDEELLTKAQYFADCAIKENDGFASGFKELGVSRLFMGRIDDSLAALSQAEHLSPQYADVLASHADSLIHASDPVSAMVKIKHAISLNPISPDIYFWTAAGASYFLQEYDQALNYIDQMDNKRAASRLAAACCGMLGAIDKARAHRAKVFEDNPSFDLERWLAVIPHKEQWQTELYREGLKRAGF
ncbi:hypothetical protein G6L72_17785 [Agrobacterium rubi]|uniref:Peptide antibiotic resistance protein n=1 Tax=Agrobacterium rubi TaxID=28099 RepID=A0AAE7USB0_9HYPH|nr:hypothetical protein [Agrobacterium rubi]NTF04219.1 hypothetical protein [Agrobacterium rubi]NTF38550.1 hypothetical protein [Agrobacterium rubi]QTG02352.1 hypothetical protein G6M88_18230 [Agrobacterium rubi]